MTKKGTLSKMFSALNELNFFFFYCIKRRKTGRKKSDDAFQIHVIFSFLKDKVTLTHLNPLNPKIKVEILICYPYTFLIDVVGRSC